jgi:hypothetical protein
MPFGSWPVLILLAKVGGAHTGAAVQRPGRASTHALASACLAGSHAAPGRLLCPRRRAHRTRHAAMAPG